MTNTKDVIDKKRVFIHRNETELSEIVQIRLEDLLKQRGFEVADEYDERVALLACIGGDGAFLHFVHQYDFPPRPIIGINTGHLGFFQEIAPDGIENFIDIYEKENYTIQNIWPVEADVHLTDGMHRHHGVNEIMVSGPHTHITHLRVDIENERVQNFSGDGVLISTSLGSTAYNYALGGSIISPELDAFQLTPIAPSNTNAYRCFRSSIMYPASLEMTLTPIRRSVDDKLEIVVDGLEYRYANIRKIVLHRSDKALHLIRFTNYNYWTKLNTKLL